MKYKVWDKQNKKWVTSNIVVDGEGNVYWSFGCSLEMVYDPQNFIVCQGFKFGETWIFEGDKVEFDVREIDEEHPAIFNQNGTVKLSKSGFLTFGNWQAAYCKNIKIVGNKYTA